MPDWLLFILSCFACFRLSELITVDDGPGDVFLKLRSWLGAYYLDSDGKPQSSIGRGIVCPWCVGIWLAAGLALILFPIGPMTALWWLAIAGGQALLQGIGGRV